MITAQELRRVIGYDPATGFMYNLKTGNSAGYATDDGYIRVTIGDRKYMAQRLAWLYVYGTWPSLVDHINGDRSDNRINNLREVTQAQNQANSKVHCNNKTGVSGLTWDRHNSKWKVSVRIGGGRRVVKRFADLHEARAFNMYLRGTHHGEYLREPSNG